MKCLCQWLLGDWIRSCRWNPSSSVARTALVTNTASRQTAVGNHIAFIIARHRALVWVREYCWRCCAAPPASAEPHHNKNPKPTESQPRLGYSPAPRYRCWPKSHLLCREIFLVKSVGATSFKDPLSLLASTNRNLFCFACSAKMKGYFSLAIYSPKTLIPHCKAVIGFLLFTTFLHYTYSYSSGLYFWHWTKTHSTPR